MENNRRDPILSYNDRLERRCTTENCVVCIPRLARQPRQDNTVVPRARSRSPTSSLGLDLSNNLNPGPSISSTTIPFFQPILSQNPQWFVFKKQQKEKTFFFF